MITISIAAIVLAVWIHFFVVAAKGLKQIPHLEDVQAPADLSAFPALTVVVPARNEEQYIEECLKSLVRQDYQNLLVVVVNDRSSDGTAQIVDRIALRHSDRVRAIHVHELPAGWLGKCHALHAGAAQAEGEYILFTDGDVIFEPAALSRAMTLMLQQKADMLVATPSLDLRSPGERIITAAFLNAMLFFAPPWRAIDPRSKVAVGIGAFNLVRASAYRAVGGHETLRLQVVDDVGLGRLVKLAGGVFRVAVGRHMFRVRWQTSTAEMITGLEKNAFAAMDYNVVRAVTGSLGFVCLHVCPWVLLALGPMPARVLAGIVIVVCHGLFGWQLRQVGRLSVFHGWMLPVGSVMMAYAILRSTAVTLRQGGIRWRDSFYPLRDLRKYRLGYIKPAAHLHGSGAPSEESRPQ